MKPLFASTAHPGVIPCVLVLAFLGAVGAACSVAAPGGAEAAGAPPPGVDDIDNSGQVPSPPQTVGGCGSCEDCGVLICSNMQWWDARQTNCGTGQSPPACSYKSALGGWWDTDLHVPSRTNVVLRHASRLDSQGTYGWGWMPQFTDMVTGHQFRFLHLHPEYKYTTDVGTIYPIGTVVGVSGGDTALTGYPRYSTAAHLCVQTPAPFADAFPAGTDGCDTSCPAGATVCSPQDHKQCSGGNLYWVDSCNAQGGLAQSCAGCGCSGSSCTQCSTSSCPSGLGDYCASDGVNLQNCSAGAYSFAAYCLAGCHVAPAGQADSCNVGSCPSGDGAYCGSDIGTGLAANGLYDCASGKVTLVKTCSNGCQVAPAGQANYCL